MIKQKQQQEQQEQQQQQQQQQQQEEAVWYEGLPEHERRKPLREVAKKIWKTQYAWDWSLRTQRIS